jgi:hypothetical protein
MNSAPPLATAPPLVTGPRGLRIAAEELTRECGRICGRLGIEPAPRAAWADTVAEGVPDDMAALLRRLD